MSEAPTVQNAPSASAPHARSMLREIADVAIAQGFLLSALWTVRSRPRGALLRRASVSRDDTRPRDEPRLARLAQAIDRAARRGVFRPTCLVRAIATERMIQRANAGPAVVRVGVLRRSDELLAHAWIEMDGRIIGDERSQIQRFTPLNDFSALTR